MKKILQLLLKALAKAIVTKYDPEIVGITGSIGKTSAKKAITAVLGSKFSIQASIKNYNNEFGLPLTILGEESAGKNLFGWLAIFIRGLEKLITIDKAYPEILILEMGIDKPGDMDYLLSIVKLKVAVLTYVGTSHLANFGSQAKLREEKAKIFKGLDRSGYAIVNLDFEDSKMVLANLKNKALTYGFSEQADVRAQNIIYDFQDDAAATLAGVNFKMHYKDSFIPVLIPSVIGEPAIYAALAGAAAGFAFGMNGVEVSSALRELETPKGRLHLIAGRNGSMIIDDTYNAAPQSVIAALDVIDSIKKTGIENKWIVLGDMLELGEGSEKGHLQVGARVASIAKAKLLYVGKEAHNYRVGAHKAGMAESKIQSFNNQTELIEYLIDKVGASDLILIKGSQGMRMERVVKALMNSPEQANSLLIRQGSEWQ